MSEAQQERIVAEFTHQAVAFNRSPAMNTSQMVGGLIDVLPVAPGQRWLEVACGPGIVARALAPHVGEVVGVDLTPAMIELARREAAGAGVHNARFMLGDAAALPFEDGAFDGAVTRSSLHHIPLPGRCVAEMARVIRPGGWVAVADHLTAPSPYVAAWHQEIERLRDPSHWACLTRGALRRLAATAGLRLVTEQIEPFALDYEEWLTRGSGGAANRALIELALTLRPGAPCFAVAAGPDGRRYLHLALGRFVWRKPQATKV